MTTAAAYARYCSNLTIDDVPESVREAARDRLLDTVGLAIGAERAESTPSILDAAGDLSASDGSATVLATGDRTAPQDAAFANGSMAHSLDYDDSHRAAAIHPGAPVVSAALAAAEAGNASGADLLAGIVAGYEVACRLGAAVNPSAHYDRGFHVTGTVGVFGATAAVGVIRELDAAELEAAFGVNGSQAAGSVQFVESGAWNKRVHPGLAARSAFTAVSLAENGFVGAEAPIDGEHGFLHGYTDDPNPEAATAGLGEEFELPTAAIKPYPCCRFTHAPIDLLRELVAEEDVDPAAVESVAVAIPEAGAKMVGKPASAYPQSFVDAQFHMPFVAAMVLVEGSASLETFFEVLDAGPTPELERLVAATEVDTAEWVEAAYPDALPGGVVVETEDETHEARTRHPLGEPENPMPVDRLRAKFDELATPVVGESAATALRERIESVESTTAAAITEPLR